MLSLCQALLALRRLVVGLALCSLFPPVMADTPAVGVNKFELLLQYLGRASNGDGARAYSRATIAMARKALDDAKDIGVPFVRVSVSGFAPSGHEQSGDLELWRRDPAVFWRVMDSMMDDLDARGIRLIPVFLWNPTQFPAMTQENVAQLVTEPSSKAWQLLAQYANEFVTRYRTRSTVLFYELTNEFNLLADLDNVRRCHQRKAPARHCSVMGNFSTDQLIAFSGRFADLLRTLDPGRLVSSGYSIPRPASGHLKARPEWSSAGADWTRDSKQLFSSQLLDLHKYLDIVSVHLYDDPDNVRFGLPDAASLLDVVKDISDAAGKRLFIGEFGNGSMVAVDVEKSHAGRLLRRIVARQVPYSAVWAWQFYQTSPYETHNGEATASSLEQGAGDELIRLIQQANVQFGRTVVTSVLPDRQAPRVVLTWPLACTRLQGRQLLHAVASDNVDSVVNVEFLVDGKRIAVDNRYPYQATLDVASLTAGLHTLTARARDHAGNVAEYNTPVLAGRRATADSCLVR